MQAFQKNNSTVPPNNSRWGKTALFIIGLLVTQTTFPEQAKADGHKYSTYEKIEWICGNAGEKNLVYKNYREGSNWKYLYVKKRLRKHGLPTIFGIIPIIESGYNENKVSTAGAAGMWQLMPGTARDMGLIVNKYADERFKIKPATGAAIKYIEMLYNKFNGNINYVLAAYNMGPGATERAIKKYKAHSIRDIRLNSQTHNYIAKFWAYATVIKRGCH